MDEELALDFLFLVPLVNDIIEIFCRLDLICNPVSCHSRWCHNYLCYGEYTRCQLFFSWCAWEWERGEAQNWTSIFGFKSSRVRTFIVWCASTSNEFHLNFTAFFPAASDLRAAIIRFRVFCAVFYIYFYYERGCALYILLVYNWNGVVLRSRDKLNQFPLPHKIIAIKITNWVLCKVTVIDVANDDWIVCFLVMPFKFSSNIFVIHLFPHPTEICSSLL